MSYALFKKSFYDSLETIFTYYEDEASFTDEMECSLSLALGNLDDVRLYIRRERKIREVANDSR